MTHPIDEAALRAWVADELTDAQIAAKVGASERTIRRKRAELGLQRDPGRPTKGRTAQLALKLEPEQRDVLHTLASNAKAGSTTNWVLGLLDAPELARAARDRSLPLEERRAALDELLAWLLGPGNEETESPAPEEAPELGPAPNAPVPS